MLKEEEEAGEAGSQQRRRLEAENGQLKAQIQVTALKAGI